MKREKNKRANRTLLLHKTLEVPSVTRHNKLKYETKDTHQARNSTQKLNNDLSSTLCFTGGRLSSYRRVLSNCLCSKHMQQIHIYILFYVLPDHCSGNKLECLNLHEQTDNHYLNFEMRKKRQNIQKNESSKVILSCISLFHLKFQQITHLFA